MSDGYQRIYEELFAARRAEEKARHAAQQAASTPLFGEEVPPPPRAPHNGTPTSIAAAESIAGHLGRLELLVLRGIIGLNGATSEELEGALQLNGNTIRPRVVTLREKGYVKDLDGTRTTRSGRQAAVHVATPEGFEAALQVDEDHRRRAA